MDNRPFDIARFMADHDLECDQDTAHDASENSTPTQRTWNMPGFHGKTRVTTTFGELPIMGLRLRDKVRTISGEFKPVQWIDEIRLDTEFLESSTDAQPIRIGRDALGENCPKADILVSPAQQLSTNSGWGGPQFRTALDLLSRPNVNRALESYVSYFVFHCGAPETIQIDGVWCRISP